ncbi:tetratricopeptide repeat protein [Numidum massiliense]|uniref:tetratricopeptide repeat protein n=1 Tax=Numidum massiliense TaxID=1522315 RepID=UPI0006D5790B|nr:tetratricopeptide repeat protein [Numidum massiliense]
MSQWDRAKRSLTNALRLFKEEGIDPQTNLEAEVYHFLSLCAFYGDQDYEQAIEQVDIALAAFQEGGDLAHLPGQMLYDKANYFFHLERYAPAYKYVAEAQKACEQTGDIRMLILSYNLEGFVFKRQRMHDRAIRCFRKAIRMSEAYHPDWQLASILYLNLGDTYYRQQKYDKSLHAYDIVNELCPRTKDDNVRATLYISYGEVFYKQQEYEKAAEYVNRATNFAKKIRLTSEYLQLLILKANIALETDSAEVEELCREGIDLADKRMLPDKKKEFLFIMAKWKVAKVTGAPLIEVQ